MLRLQGKPEGGRDPVENYYDSTIHSPLTTQILLIFFLCFGLSVVQGCYNCYYDVQIYLEASTIRSTIWNKTVWENAAWWRTASGALQILSRAFKKILISKPCDQWWYYNYDSIVHVRTASRPSRIRDIADKKNTNLGGGPHLFPVLFIPSIFRGLAGFWLQPETEAKDSITEVHNK